MIESGILPKEFIKVGLSWRGKYYLFGETRWSQKGTFYFQSAFHKEEKTLMEWGYATIHGNNFNISEISERTSYDSDLHLTLHPPEGGKKSVIHVRGVDEEILPENRRNANWFPVQQPFNVMHVFSPPLDTLLPTEETLDFTIPIVEDYLDSLRCKIDIFPPSKELKTIEPGLVGITPHFLVRLGFIPTRTRLPGMMLWPAEDVLSL